MTQSMAEEKVDLLELAHYGVKGMKWGVRREKSSSQDIKLARARQTQKKAQLKSQAAKVKSATSDKGRAAAEKKLADLKVSYLNNPDRATAKRLTTGQKAAVVVLTATTGPIGLAVGGAAAGRAVTRRTIEGRQDRKVYG